MTIRTTSSLLALVVAGLSAPCLAQAEPAGDRAAPNAPPAEAEDVIEDIVVTAERRESTVRQVPFSIAAFGGEALRDQLVFNPAALVQAVPGITINTADKSLAVATIRGNVSTFRTATLDTPVAFFADDIYYPYNSDLNTNFFDTARVEVLRGPQGTLFGRNVVGGAIAVITNNPVFDTDYFASVNVGNGGYARTEGMANGVITDDKVAARIAFSTERSDGLIDTPNQKGNYGEIDGHAIRGKLLFTPSDALKIVVAGDYSYTDGNGSSVQLDVGDPGVVPATFGNFVNKPWTNNDVAPAFYSQRLRGGYLRSDLDLGGGTLSSITGYRMNDSDVDLNNIPTGTPPVFGFNQNISNRSFTQEVRFASAPNRFSYVIGTFYLSGDVHSINTYDYSPLPGSAVAGAIPANPRTTNIVRDQKGDIDSIAVFGEGTFEVSDAFALVVGGRYTRDRKEIDYRAFSTTNGNTPINVFAFPGTVAASGGNTWKAFTPRVTAKFKPNEDVNLYATYSRGFKSGGFVDNAYRNPTLPLNPEKADNFEIGAKSRLFDNRFDFNIALFRQKTKNLQNFSGAGGIAHTYNGTAVAKGVEIESLWRVTRDLRLIGNYAYIDGKYTSLIDPLAGGVDFSGNPLKYTPRNAFTLGANYAQEVSNGGEITYAADYSYSSRVSVDDANTIATRSPNLYDDTRGSTLNARIGYESPDGRWNVGVWGKNLTDNYQISVADDVTSFVAPGASTTRYWKSLSNMPRTYGLTVSVRR